MKNNDKKRTKKGEKHERVRVFVIKRKKNMKMFLANFSNAFAV